MESKAPPTPAPLGRLFASVPAGAPYNFCYGLCVLDHVFCEIDQVTLSDFTTLKKARKVTSRVGKQLLGVEAIAQSRRVGELPWNRNDQSTSHSVFPPFNPEMFIRSRFEVKHFRRYEWSDCVLEVRFKANDSTDSNAKYFTMDNELRRAVTAMRLLGDAPIRALGPLEVRTHPSVRGPALGLGNPDDEVLGGKVENDKFLELNVKACRDLKKIFRALKADLPDAIVIAIARLNMSFTRGSAVDQFIDTIIGLEALYLGVDSNELRFRLALRVSGHQDIDPASRWKKFKTVQVLYDARSELIHGAKHGLNKLLTAKFPYSSESELLAGARSILRCGCERAVLDHAQRPPGSWQDYLHEIDRAVVCGR